MEGDEGMPAEPLLDLRRLVATEVVQDHVDGPLWVVREDAVQEAEEVPRMVPILALSLRLYSRPVQRGKQLRRAVPFVVMRPPSDLVRPHGQLRLTAIQRLHLRLLIHAEQHGIVRRIRVQTYNADEFLPELWIVRRGERSNPMGMQPCPGEDVPHCLPAYTSWLGQRAHTPMGLGLRRAGAGHLDHPAAVLLRVLDGSPLLGPIGQGGQASFAEPSSL